MLSAVWHYELRITVIYNSYVKQLIQLITPFKLKVIPGHDAMEKYMECGGKTSHIQT
jgi:hypothetical protein